MAACPTWGVPAFPLWVEAPWAQTLRVLVYDTAGLSQGRPLLKGCVADLDALHDGVPTDVWVELWQLRRGSKAATDPRRRAQDWAVPPQRPRLLVSLTAVGAGRPLTPDAPALRVTDFELMDIPLPGGGRPTASLSARLAYSPLHPASHWYRLQVATPTLCPVPGPDQCKPTETAPTESRARDDGAERAAAGPPPDAGAFLAPQPLPESLHLEVFHGRDPLPIGAARLLLGSLVQHAPVSVWLDVATFRAFGAAAWRYSSVQSCSRREGKPQCRLTLEALHAGLACEPCDGPHVRVHATDAERWGRRGWALQLAVGPHVRNCLVPAGPAAPPAPDPSAAPQPQPDPEQPPSAETSPGRGPAFDEPQRPAATSASDPHADPDAGHTADADGDPPPQPQPPSQEGPGADSANNSPEGVEAVPRPAPSPVPGPAGPGSRQPSAWSIDAELPVTPSPTGVAAEDLALTLWDLQGHPCPATGPLPGTCLAQGSVPLWPLRPQQPATHVARLRWLGARPPPEPVSVQVTCTARDFGARPQVTISVAEADVEGLEGDVRLQVRCGGAGGPYSVPLPPSLTPSSAFDAAQGPGFPASSASPLTIPVPPSPSPTLDLQLCVADIGVISAVQVPLAACVRDRPSLHTLGGPEQPFQVRVVVTPTDCGICPTLGCTVLSVRLPRLMSPGPSAGPPPDAVSRVEAGSIPDGVSDASASPKSGDAGYGPLGVRLVAGRRGVRTVRPPLRFVEGWCVWDEALEPLSLPESLPHVFVEVTALATGAVVATGAVAMDQLPEGVESVVTVPLQMRRRSRGSLGSSPSSAQSTAGRPEPPHSPTPDPPSAGPSSSATAPTPSAPPPSDPERPLAPRPSPTPGPVPDGPTDADPSPDHNSATDPPHEPHPHRERDPTANRIVDPPPTNGAGADAVAHAPAPPHASDSAQSLAEGPEPCGPSLLGPTLRLALRPTHCGHAPTRTPPGAHVAVEVLELYGAPPACLVSLTLGGSHGQTRGPGRALLPALDLRAQALGLEVYAAAQAREAALAARGTCPLHDLREGERQELLVELDPPVPEALGLDRPEAPDGDGVQLRVALTAVQCGRPPALGPRVWLCVVQVRHLAPAPSEASPASAASGGGRRALDRVRPGTLRIAVAFGAGAGPGAGEVWRIDTLRAPNAILHEDYLHCLPPGQTPVPAPRAPAPQAPWHLPPSPPPTIPRPPTSPDVACAAATEPSAAPGSALKARSHRAPALDAAEVVPRAPSPDAVSTSSRPPSAWRHGFPVAMIHVYTDRSPVPFARFPLRLDTLAADVEVWPRGTAPCVAGRAVGTVIGGPPVVEV